MDSKTADQRAASISFRQLELFVAVSRLGGVQRAAEACGLSQPAATQALTALQQRTGQPLLERGLTGTKLTPLGRIFLPRAERALIGVKAAVADLRVADVPAVVRQLTPASVATLSGAIECGSLEQAAQARSITRDGIRRSGVRLEARLGRLFDRTPDGMQLTAAGDQFARRICGLRREIAVGIGELHARQDRQEKTIVVGAAQAFGNRLLARVLVELSQEHPDAIFTVLREGPGELVARLRAGEADLVVGDIDDTGADLHKERLVETPYYVFARPGHPLSSPEPVTVEQLARYDWVGGTPGSVREAVRDILFAGRPQPRLAFAASEGAIVGHFVAGSDRLALMTEHESRCGGLALARLPLAPLESGLGIDVVRRRDRAPSHLHRELVEALRAHLLPADADADDQEWRVA